ncbi:L-seryl-tRNA(Sec) selenium transferase [Evansella clarkii]|uniref:L-seryl-tRNA(Sec) selenium transferase n=1 Tax=Evansella clarkii TaxID=79879 RepID=UPI002F261F5A
MMANVMRLLPAVHEIQQTDKFDELKVKKEIPGLLLKEWTQQVLDEFRENIKFEPGKYDEYSRDSFIEAILDKLEKKAAGFSKFRLRRVINGTGTVLHTNLGRARLSERAVRQVVETSGHYSNLEYDISEGKRGSRHDIIQDLLAKAAGSEAAIAVNNNAAAVYFILRALASGREVVVSRGELVEIGGSFRVSTIMEESEAQLVEVGTTNKTHPYDYENAINEKTRMLMKVHTSNFKTVGFTKEVATKELTEIASRQERGEDDPLLVYEDLGSGSLFPFMHAGIGEEPVVKEALKNGADIVSFSGDKLLGGPQAGIIAGKKKWIDKLKKHPLARVLRVDKMTLAALEATLFEYVYNEENLSDIPAVRDILASKESIREKAEAFLERAGELCSDWQFEMAEDHSQVGGGTMPVEELPTVGLKLKVAGITANKLESMLRKVEVPVVTRIKDGEVFIDFRTIAEDETALLIRSLQEVQLSS